MDNIQKVEEKLKDQDQLTHRINHKPYDKTVKATIILFITNIHR